MRRFFALLGFVVVLALAATLLYRVYVHHNESSPYAEDEPAVVSLS